jgi:hypothetical protein
LQFDAMAAGCLASKVIPTGDDLSQQPDQVATGRACEDDPISQPRSNKITQDFDIGTDPT